MKRWILGTLLAVVALSHLPATAGEGGSYRVALVPYHVAAEYTKNWLEAIREHPFVRDGKVTLTTHDGGGDLQTQIRQYNALFADKPDAIILVAHDPDASRHLLELAAAENVLVVSSGSYISSPEVSVAIFPDDLRAGYISALAVILELGGKGDIVILNGPNKQSANLRRHGIGRALSEHPDVRVLEERSVDWSLGGAFQTTNELLEKHKGRVQGIIAANDELALGAVEALKASGTPIPPVTGIDGIPRALAAVAAGEMLMTLRQDPMNESHAALDLVLRRLEGPGYEPFSKCWGKEQGLPWDGGMGTFFIIPWTVVYQ